MSAAALLAVGVRGHARHPPEAAQKAGIIAEPAVIGYFAQAHVRQQILLRQLHAAVENIFVDAAPGVACKLVRKVRYADGEAARNVLEAREKYRQELDEVELQYNARIEQINQETQDAQYQCDIVQKALDALRERREVLNEDIRREKKKIEEQTFFKVNLSPEALSDIQVLREIAPKLNRRIDIDKMIYDTYCAKPVLEMTRRVLNGEQPSGIYKITREKTGEI